VTGPPGPELSDPWWYERTQEIAARQMLRGDHRCDVTVVGGGVAGLHAALRLAASGARVVLVEREFCGSRMSGRSSGFLTPDSELELHPLIARFGAEEASTLWEIASTGVRRILHTVRAHDIECDLVDPLPSLFVGIGEDGTKTVLAEARARSSIGYEFALFDEAALPQIHAGGYQAGVCYGGTGAIDPLAYCHGMRRVLVARGVRVFEDSPVVAIEGSTVIGEHGRVRGGQAVV
jgi:gamma-glutamylputrescine oxidase